MTSLTTPEIPPEEVFAVDFATLAREIAMDIFPVHDVLRLHQLTDEQWQRIQSNPKFQQMLGDMVTEWNSTASTKERIKIKAQTGLESELEHYVRAIKDENIPLAQRVEAGKFLAKLGELDGNVLGGAGGSGFNITLNIGTTSTTQAVEIKPKQIELTAIPE